MVMLHSPRPQPAAHHAGSTLEPKGHDLAACLQQSTLYREYQHAFQTATGLPLVFRPAGSLHAPFHGAKNANGFSSLMSPRSKTCAACLQSRLPSTAVTA